MFRIVAVLGVISGLALSGCTSNGRPEHALAWSDWTTDEQGTDLLVFVGVYDDRWMSLPCDCDIAIALDDQPERTWTVTEGDFMHAGTNKTAWQVRLPGADVDSCAGFQVGHSLDVTVTVGRTVLRASDTGIACKPTG